MSRELRITKGDVELAIHFNTKEELTEGLSDYEEITKIVQEKLGISLESKRTVRKDLEGIIEVNNGKMILVKAPKLKVEKVCLALHAVGEDGATPSEVAAISHVQNPSRSILTSTVYKKYFRRTPRKKYVLSDQGLYFTTNTIIPELKGDTKNATT